MPTTREQWFVTNTTANPISLGDITTAPSIDPNRKIDLLVFSSRDVITQSEALLKCLTNGWLVLDKVIDGTSSTISEGNAANAITVAEKLDAAGGGLPIAGGELTGNLIVDGSLTLKTGGGSTYLTIAYDDDLGANLTDALGNSIQIDSDNYGLQLSGMGLSLGEDTGIYDQSHGWFYIDGGINTYAASLLDNGQITTDGSGNFAVGGATNLNGGLAVIGPTELDNGHITTDGSGDVSVLSITATGAGVFGSISSDSGTITTDGTGNLNAKAFIGKSITPMQSLTFAASMAATNASLGNIFTLTLTGNVTSWANPSNPTNGQRITWKIVQDTTGSRTVIWPTNFDWGAASAPTLSSSPNKIDYVTGIYDAINSKWDMLIQGQSY